MTPRKMPVGGSRHRVVQVVGRPRKVTDGDIAEILAWHAARETCAQLAQRLGLSQATIRRVIRTRGRHFKKPPPEDPDWGGRHPCVRESECYLPFAGLCGEPNATPPLRRADLNSLRTHDRRALQEGPTGSSKARAVRLAL